MKCLDNAHRYEMDTFLNEGKGMHPGEYHQPFKAFLGFYEMREDGTKIDGVTNEEVLKVLIHRLKALDGKLPCIENDLAIKYIESALALLDARTEDRKAKWCRGQDGAMKPDAPIHRPFAWTTEAELAFLDGIGTFKKEARRIDLGQRKLKCLYGYKKGSLLRKDWGRIDWMKILPYLEQKIKEGEHGRGKEKEVMGGKEKTDGRIKDSGPGREGDSTTEQGESSGSADTTSSPDRTD